MPKSTTHPFTTPLTLQHGCGQFSRESTISLRITPPVSTYVHLPNVLSSHLDLLTKKTLRETEMESSGSDHDIAIRLELGSSVERGNQLLKGSHSSVLRMTALLCTTHAFPVTTDEDFASHAVYDRKNELLRVFDTAQCGASCREQRTHTEHAACRLLDDHFGTAKRVDDARRGVSLSIRCRAYPAFTGISQYIFRSM